MLEVERTIRAEATPTCQSANPTVNSLLSFHSKVRNGIIICFAIHTLSSNQGLVDVEVMEEWRCGAGGKGGRRLDFTTSEPAPRFQAQGLWQRRWSPTTEREDH